MAAVPGAVSAAVAPGAVPGAVAGFGLLPAAVAVAADSGWIRLAARWMTVPRLFLAAVLTPQITKTFVRFKKSFHLLTKK